jgi:hypothetical protein
MPHPIEPCADGGQSEFRRVGRNTDADRALIGRQVVDPLGGNLAKALIFEVVDPHTPRIALRSIIGSAVSEVADQFLLLAFHGHDGLAVSLSGHNFPVDVLVLWDDPGGVVMYTLDGLRGMGIGIEIDNFGTGHASFLALMRVRQDRPLQRNKSYPERIIWIKFFGQT